MSHPTPRRSTSSLVKIGNDDPTLTGHGALLLTGELVRRFEVVETIETRSTGCARSSNGSVA